MVDACALPSPTWQLFAHAPSGNAGNRDLPGIQPVFCANQRCEQPRFAPRSQQRCARSRASRWNTAVKISSFGGKVKSAASSHQNRRSWSAEWLQGPGETPAASGGLAAVLLAEGRVGRGPAGGSARRTRCCWREAAWDRALLAEGRAGRGGAGRRPGAGFGAAGTLIRPRGGWRWSPSNRLVLPKPDWPSTLRAGPQGSRCRWGLGEIS
jgi:hypothetical protein